MGLAEAIALVSARVRISSGWRRVSRSPRDAPSAGVVGVYRVANAEHVLRIVESARSARWQSAWWALDHIHPALRDVTVGTGPGLKLPLLNRALAALGEVREWTLLADDDVRFLEGDVLELVRMSQQAAVDLAQPARQPGTSRSHAITTAVPWSRARLTTFIESGPLVAVGPRFRERILPLPEGRGMGWGLELDWLELHRDGCRLGIIDAVRVEHVGDVGHAYDVRAEHERLQAELAAKGYPDWEGVRTTLAVWRPWRRRPPWAEREQGGREYARPR